MKKGQCNWEDPWKRLSVFWLHLQVDSQEFQGFLLYRGRGRIHGKSSDSLFKRNRVFRQRSKVSQEGAKTVTGTPSSVRWVLTLSCAACERRAGATAVTLETFSLRWSSNKRGARALSTRRLMETSSLSFRSLRMVAWTILSKSFSVALRRSSRFLARSAASRGFRHTMRRSSGYDGSRISAISVVSNNDNCNDPESTSLRMEGARRAVIHSNRSFPLNSSRMGPRKSYPDLPQIPPA